MKQKPIVYILHGHKNNFGGVVNFYKKLEPYFTSSDFNIIRFRVGANANSKVGTFWPIRIFDLIYILTTFSFVLLFNRRIRIVHFNPSLNKKAVFRDFLFVKLIKTLNRNIKIIYHIRGWNNYLANNLGNPSLFNSVLKYQLVNSDSIIVLSSIYKKQIVDKISLSNLKIFILPTSADTVAFNNISYDKYKEFKINLLFLSRAVKQKGLFHLIDALVKLKNQNSYSINLIVAGDGRDLIRAKQYATQKGLNEFISFVGYVKGKEKYKILNESHIFIFPSYLSEGCPNAVLEAMAAGLPVITTSVGCLKDIVINEENGYIVKQQSVDDIVWAVNKLVNNPELMVKMGKKNREKAIKEFDNEVIFKKIEEIYHQVLR